MKEEPMQHNTDSDSYLFKYAAKQPQISEEEERRLFLAWKEHQDYDARNKLIEPHIRLAISKARKYVGRAEMKDLQQEACLGMIRTAETFDLDKGYRFSTYARSWIDAFLRDYSMKNLSVIRIAGSAPQKRILSNSAKARRTISSQLEARGITLTRQEMDERVAQAIGVSVAELQMTETMMYGQTSINAPIGRTEDGGEITFEDTLPQPDKDEGSIGTLDMPKIKGWISDAINSLPEREACLIRERVMSENPPTLEEFANRFQVSRERVRQIETRAIKLLKAYMSQYEESVMGMFEDA